MKKLFFAAVAGAILLAGCQNKQAAAGSAADETGEVSTEKYSGEVRIAYINVDSLIAGYNLAIDLQTAFRTKAEKADKELTTKASRWEKEMMDAQEKVQKGLVTRSQAAELEERLGRQQQEIVGSRDTMLSELAEEEQVMNNRIFYAITDYLKEFNADYKYSMIISTSGSGPILHADPGMDITAEVLKALNEDYAKERSAEQKK
jgi:outer membrane protein